MNKEEFLNCKKEINTHNTIPAEFVPYMYEFYKVECAKRNWLVLVHSVDEFALRMQQFLEMPLTTGDNVAEMVMNRTNQTIEKGIRNTIKYFDNLYGIS